MPLQYGNEQLARYAVDALDQYLAEAASHPLLTAAEERMLARRIERGDLATKERLVTHNLRLVVSIARRYQGSELSLLDLIQEGTIGLIRAAEKYDWRRGLRFSTYATLWIRQAIGKALTEKSRAIRLPAEVARKEQRIERARSELVRELGRTPMIDELATAAGMRAADVAELDNAARVVTSLDRPIGETEDGMSLGEWLPASEDVCREIMLRLDRRTVRQAVAQLGEPAASVIRARFGLDGDPEPLSYSEIAKRLRMSRRTVRAIELRALDDLARLRELQGLSDAA
jgi:RNA polymerase primary sigma factor